MIEFILSAPFVIGAVVTIAIIIAVLLEFEKNGWATTLFSLGVGLTLWAYKREIWEVVSGNPMPTIYFALAYIGAGLAWSLMKWKLYINKRVDRFEEAKREFLRTGKEIKSNWKDWVSFLNSKIPSYLRNASFYESDSPDDIAESLVPIATEKKALIVSWISYWPMSLGATFLNNPFRRFFEWIYGLVSGIYDKMGTSATKKIAAGLEKDEDQGGNAKKKKEVIHS
jgi:hypothetical protein